MKAMDIARLEIADITAELTLQRARRDRVPPVSNYLAHSGNSIYVN